jgi:hypothetical protein
MRDPQKWKFAIARFNGYYANIPSWLKAEEIADYHTLNTALEEASGEDLSNFRIPADKINDLRQKESSAKQDRNLNS